MIKEPKYLILVFKIEGHSTWRMLSGPDEKQIMAQLTSREFPKVTAKKFIEIDRITGKIEEY